jgi:translation initiation factor 4E
MAEELNSGSNVNAFESLGADDVDDKNNITQADDDEGQDDRDDNQEDHPLERQWVLWYDPATTKDWNKWFESLHQVYTFNTIEDFWRLYNNIESPSNLKPRTSYFVFVNGVQPMWEHEANRKGGKWFVEFDTRSKTADLDQLWMYALLAAIGESLPASESVLGIQVSAVKNNRGKINVWTKDALDEESNMKIGQSLKDLWKLTWPISYVAHDDSIKAGAARHGNALYTV